MKIVCCKCGKKYSFKLYHSDKYDALIVCPYCSEVHSVSFDSVSKPKVISAEKINELKLKTYYLTDYISGSIGVIERFLHQLFFIFLFRFILFPFQLFQHAVYFGDEFGFCFA